MEDASTCLDTARARPFRFCVGGPMKAESRAELISHIQMAERSGFDVLSFPDHLFLGLDPIVAMTVAAEASERIRIASLVLAAGLHNPVVLAKQLATLDLVSGGRLEVGIGAGWSRADFESSGLEFEPAPTRIERLLETVAVLRGIWAGPGFSYRGRRVVAREVPGVPAPCQKNGPPILVGGGGKRILSAAGRCADIVTIAGSTIAGPTRLPDRAALAERVRLVASSADSVARHPEMHILLSAVVVTSDRRSAARQFTADWPTGSGPPPSENDVLASPFVAIGSEQEIADQLLSQREEFGISFISVRSAAAPAMAGVIKALIPRDVT